MLAHEAQDALPVPERPPGEQPAIRVRVPRVPHDRRGDAPALPACPGGPVAEVDVLAVHAEAAVEATELVQHRPAQEEEGAEHPVRLDGLRRPLVEEVVPPLAAERPEGEAEGRAPDEGAADGGKATPGRLPGAVRVDEPPP